MAAANANAPLVAVSVATGGQRWPKSGTTSAIYGIHCWLWHRFRAEKPRQAVCHKCGVFGTGWGVPVPADLAAAIIQGYDNYWSVRVKAMGDPTLADNPQTV